MILRTPDNRVKVGPDLGGRKHKSLFIVYGKKGPEFRELTPQQKVIKKVGEFCGDLIEGNFGGGGENWTRRKKAYKVCTRKIFTEILTRDITSYTPEEVARLLQENKAKIEEALRAI